MIDTFYQIYNDNSINIIKILVIEISNNYN